MSKQYPGGIISKTAPVPSGPFENSTAPGIWTLEQQAYWQKLGQWPIPGNTQNFIEDVFNTYVYTGSNSATTITNGIDLSTKGGLVWTKGRTGSADNHLLIDTVRGVNKPMRSNEAAAQYTETTLTAFNTTGYDITGANGDINLSGRNYVGWTFREQAKFFDIVTWTGDGTTNRAIPHNLGSTPGCYIVKSTSAATDWIVWHRSLTGNSYNLVLNTTAAQANYGLFSTTAPNSTNIYLGTAYPAYYNDSGQTYVAYLFAHDAGGFGNTSTDNVISCGSFVGTGSDLSVNLGYEPQWLLVKRASSGTENWAVYDNMRGMFVNYDDNILFPNTSGAEVQVSRIAPTATGFNVASGYPASGTTYIYIAIRRGPMAVPTLGTSVFEPVAYTGTGTDNRIITSSITPDSVIPSYRNTTGAKYWYDRLRGSGTYLIITGTNAEGNEGATYGPQFNKVQTGYQQGTSDSGFLNQSSYTYVNWLFKRAPGFFDEVCYTGNSTSGLVVNHNLAVVPELVIFKKRAGATGGWPVWTTSVGTGTSFNYLNATSAVSNQGVQIFTTTPTSSALTLGSWTGVNDSNTMVAYLFATCAGVSKVGSYTGTGAAQTINCGFTGGSRFVLIKRTDSTGDWYVWDSARGIIPSNDPYLLLNSTAAEVTGTDYVDTTSVGFDITSTAPAAINANGGTFIFLAIA
jgi:hypothetical protein